MTTPSPPLDDLLAAWIAANDCDALAVQHYSKKLGIMTYHGEFNKPELVVISKRYGFDHSQIDNGIWVNYAGGKPLSKKEMEDAVSEAEDDMK